MTKNESNYIKGLAILLMIFYHLYYNDRFLQYGLTGIIGTVNTMHLIVRFGHVCVPIYAFLTGYGFTKKEKQEKINSKSQIKKYVTLVTDLFFVIVCCFLISRILQCSFSLTELWGDKLDVAIGVLGNSLGLAGILDIPWMNSSWWYISLYLYFIFVFPISYVIMKKSGLGISVGLAVLTPSILRLNVVNDTFGRYFPPFYLGMIFAEYEVIEKIKKWLGKDAGKKIVCVVLQIGIICGLVAIRERFEKQYLIETILALAVVMLGIILYELKGIFCYILMKIGENSMYMWLIHVFVYGYWLNVWSGAINNIWLIWIEVSIVTFIMAFLLRKVKNYIQILCKKYIANDR